MSVNIAVIGPGLVGSEFIAQIAAYQARATSQYRLSIIAISNSKRLLVQPSGINLKTWSNDLQASPLAADLQKLADAAAGKAPSVIVDCTSSDSVASLYPAWLKRGIHIVTPNKKGFSGPISLFDEIKALTKPKPGVRYPLALHESTVGAGLPLLSTLNDLVETGDEIVKVEGIFSGTLSFIFNNFSVAGSGPKPKFSEIVKAAKEKGYTEPDPRDDLNGMDVARKVVILGRLSGVPLTLESLSIENIVPEALRGVPSSDAFMAQLPDFDEYFSKLNDEALARGEVLRCVGVVDPKGGSCVKLLGYPLSHPFASLKGSDNIVAFTTKRFPNPLIVQGAGAGAAVTAFGMFSDVLKVASAVTYGAQ
ncbi:homoserine dehydrogenase-domain-containing protein [Chytridium lagenaria]|nr:homoserine dehydrogenase-domain-containing protein [Chytridium lagenaria]